jgi:hypothetical protein
VKHCLICARAGACQESFRRRFKMLQKATSESPPRAPPPLNWTRPPAGWGRWSPLCLQWVKNIRARVRPEDQWGAFEAVALLRELLDLEPTPDNFGRPAKVIRQPGDDSEGEK